MADKHDHEHCSHADDEILKKIKELPLKDRVKAVAIYHYTQKKANLDTELEMKIKSLQKESDLLALPFYDQQSQLITGQRAPTAQELASLDDYFTEAETQQKEEFRQNSEPLEGFWGKVIENCDEIKQRYNPEGPNEKDSDVLKYLLRIKAELSADSDDFTLRFIFKENEHFTNTELTKTFHFKAPKDKAAHDHDHHHDEQEEDFPFKTVGTEIKWNAGKDITKKTIQKKQKNKKSGASRTVNKQVDAESFFNFFRSINFEDKDNLEDEQADEQDAKMEDDYETGRTIIDEVIPFSLEYYLGINPENADDDFDDVDDEDEGDDDEDKEEDNDTDEDDGKKKGKKGGDKSNRKKSGDSSKSKDKKDNKKAGDKAPEKADCKQQ